MAEAFPLGLANEVNGGVLLRLFEILCIYQSTYLPSCRWEYRVHSSVILLFDLIASLLYTSIDINISSSPPHMSEPEFS